MERLKNFFDVLWRDESAGPSIEYGLLTAVFVLGTIAMWITFGGEVTNFFGRISTRIANCPSASGC